MKHALISLFLLSVASCSSTPNTATAWDTTVPDYGSSAYERRTEQGKYYEGSSQYPYSNRESNVQRDNRELREREAAEAQRRRYEQDNSRSNSGAQYGSSKPRW